jgi:hypothetical protein
MGNAAKKRARPALDEDAKEAAARKELADLLYEHSVIADRMDALEEMKKVRRDRILLLMRDLGLSKFEGDAGDISFQSRRSFRVRDHERLAQLMSPLQLAALASITADVYDAAVAEKVPIDEAVVVGQSESMTVSRARTKAEKDRRKQHIEESKRQAEQRIAALREQFSK